MIIDPALLTLSEEQTRSLLATTASNAALNPTPTSTSPNASTPTEGREPSGGPTRSKPRSSKRTGEHVISSYQQIQHRLPELGFSHSLAVNAQHWQVRSTSESQPTAKKGGIVSDSTGFLPRFDLLTSTFPVML